MLHSQLEVMRYGLHDQVPFSQTIGPITVASHLPGLGARDALFLKFKADVVQLGSPLSFFRNFRNDRCHSQSGNGRGFIGSTAVR